MGNSEETYAARPGRLYSCIISQADETLLISVAQNFSYSIERIEDGILFDVSGLERLIGKPEQIEQQIIKALKEKRIPGSVAVAATIETATLLARHAPREKKGESALNTSDAFDQLPLASLGLAQDTLNVFNDLGLYHVEDLAHVPKDDLVNRYGTEFESVIRAIRQQGDQLLTPNIKQDQVSWGFTLDNAVEDFEQLIFLLNHGLEILFEGVRRYGHSTEHLDISFKLSDRSSRKYEIKTSFPTLERAFWLKLVNIRVALDPPQAGIVGVNVTAHFTKPRPDQRGLYAVSRPEPESLLLTVGKIKKLVGEKNVGVPVLLDQRLPEAFALDPDKLPAGSESLVSRQAQGIVSFSYFRPPLRAEVLTSDGYPRSIKTQYFTGEIIETSGVWRSNSQWWDQPWELREWDIQIEGHGVYRICRAGKEWFITGEYD